MSLSAVPLLLALLWICVIGPIIGAFADPQPEGGRIAQVILLAECCFVAVITALFLVTAPFGHFTLRGR